MSMSTKSRQLIIFLVIIGALTLLWLERKYHMLNMVWSLPDHLRYLIAGAVGLLALYFVWRAIGQFLEDI